MLGPPSSSSFTIRRYSPSTLVAVSGGADPV